MEGQSTIEKKYNFWIIALSVIIPVAVAVLFTIKLSDFGLDVQPFYFLPPIYAGINGVTAILLVAALWAIKNKNVKLHENLMKTCIGLSLLFLVMYVAYHMSADSTPYGGEGIGKLFYYFILITHVFLSIAVIPLVLVSYVRALAQRFDKHRKIAKITFPIWLYIAITGVIVYVMIAPYYGS
ncbi:DUF420 domain-containing protein [Neptunitalea lumnitzerae]|uniref:DUF420 domain-containing protein n=1 Tax=Neptunitalea lumnitzerae TaxID=2965509 RepID=A0ABQ5MMW1_9FLAO|nr:DUF420 domain-containing protein [Neptunitalea sp. Y10]GLB50666.1 hypothetical protein Y10_30340 [Neptunitalea sp. Y10]